MFLPSFPPLISRLLTAVFMALVALVGAVRLSYAQDAPSTGNAPDTETVQTKFQGTFVWQRHPGFSVRPPATLDISKYSGDYPLYSLSNLSDKTYTGSFTGYFGLRPWANGELYFNPEVAQGVPFSGGLQGLGGFYNGEITRAAGTNPRPYRQRLFVRQTWNQSGGAGRVTPDFNWLAGAIDRDRFVLTAGNFSLLDVFDKNAYANDPRRQFMNWGTMASAAYDYAADARGFGWGVAGEWYRGDWTVRAARMTGPMLPNGQSVDFKLLKHYGDQIEVEHRHTLSDQPGAVRVLAWRNRAKLASFADATRYGDSVGWQAGANGMEYILDVRGSEKIKHGIGFNADQAVGSDAGVFVRAMWGDGKTETYAFGEVDRSVSAGGVISGKRWGRAQDTVGAAYIAHYLSPDRRNYLAKGGISFFIGDGWLNYKPEQIVELYYNLNLHKTLWVTANYQRYANPAYNADRGPVHIMGLRFHTEF